MHANSASRGSVLDADAAACAALPAESALGSGVLLFARGVVPLVAEVPLVEGAVDDAGKGAPLRRKER